MKGIISKSFVSALLFFVCTCAFANTGNNDATIGKKERRPFPNNIDPVSPLPVNKVRKIKLDINYNFDSIIYSLPGNNEDEEDISGLVKMEEEYRKSSNNGKEMLRLLKTMKVKRAFRNRKYQQRLYNDLANISARLKLYPLAMKYHYQIMQLKNDEPVAPNGTVLNPGVEEQDSNNLLLMDEDLTITDSLEIVGTYNNKVESAPITLDDILESFEDGKSATDYALMLHVKQPSPGKRKAFTGIDNVGHMFITLIKYNSDKTYTSRSFGYYPQKTSFLSSTPLHPTTEAVFKDDALHDWDETIGKFISHRRFIKIIKLLIKYECKMYNLNQNNCTDLGLTIASLSGISIKDTKGTWPLGGGNNPANAGQSILEEKLDDEDSGNKEGLFIFKK